MKLLATSFGYSQGSRQGVLDRPPSLQSAKDGIMGHVQLFSPIAETLSASLQRQPMIVAAITALFIVCAPVTILRFVISVVVSPLKRELGGWSLAHIGKEIFEFAPTFTDLDAATTISVKAIVSRIGHPLNHRSPDMVNGRTKMSVSPVVTRGTYTLLSHCMNLRLGLSLVRALGQLQLSQGSFILAH